MSDSSLVSSIEPTDLFVCRIVGYNAIVFWTFCDVFTARCYAYSADYAVATERLLK